MHFIFYCILEDWWSSLEPSIMTKHILMWKNALSFLLRNGLLVTHNPGVKLLLQLLKQLHKVSVHAPCLSIIFMHLILFYISVIS